MRFQRIIKACNDCQLYPLHNISFFKSLGEIPGLTVPQTNVFNIFLLDLP